MIGSGINPALGRIDFSGYERGGAAVGQGLASAGASIGDAIKVNNEMKKKAESYKQVAQAIQKAFPNQPIGEQAAQALATLTNPDVSLRDQLAVGEGIQQALQIGVMGMEQARQDEMMALRRQAMAAKAAGSGAQQPQMPSQGSIQAALELMNVSGYGPQADVLRQRLSTAGSPEEQMQIASMISSYASELGPGKLETAEERRIREEALLLDKEKLKMEQDEAKKPEKEPRPTSLEQRAEFIRKAQAARKRGDIEEAEALEQAVRLDMLDIQFNRGLSGQAPAPTTPMFDSSVLD